MESTTTSFEVLANKCRPHSIFNTDWSSYTSFDFAEIFIPEINAKEANNVFLFDGAEIFNLLSTPESRKVKNEKTFDVFLYTYPKTVMASLKKELVQPGELELCCFIELDENDEVDLYFRSGSQVSSIITSLISPYSLDFKPENDVFHLSKREVGQFFNSKIDQEEIVAFIFEMAGVSREPLVKHKAMQELSAVLTDIKDTFRFDAGFAREDGEEVWSHGDIEEIALQGKKYSNDQILKIYFGNWLRDYSSILTSQTIGFGNADISTLKNVAPFDSNNIVKKVLIGQDYKFTHDGWLKIIELLAVKEFVYNKKNDPSENYLIHKQEFDKRFGEITKTRLGLYLPQEHIDNPKGMLDESILGSSQLINPVIVQHEKSKGQYLSQKMYAGENTQSLEVNKTTKMKRYIKEDIDEKHPSSFAYFSEQLRLTASYGRTQAGYRHFGAALHVLEDYYAHTNFVEVLLIKIGKTKVYPWVELPPDVKKMTNGWKKAEKIPIVTGKFGSSDILASMAPKIANEFFPVGINSYKKIGIGERTFFDELMIVVLEDLAQKETGKKDSEKTRISGLTFQEIRDMFDDYLYYRDKWVELQKTPIVGPVLQGVDVVTHYLGQYLKYFPNLLFNLLLKSVSHGVKEDQTKNESGYGTDPTHTQIAKDSVEHPLNPLAGKLAYLAVGKITEMMSECWNGKRSIETIIDWANKRYFVHPCDTDWADKHTKNWAKTHISNVKKAESKTIYGHYKSEVEKLIELGDEEIKKLQRKEL